MAKFKGGKFKGGDIKPPPKQKPCAACSGSGRYDSKGSPACGACNGKGFDTIEEASAAYVAAKRAIHIGCTI